MSGQAKQGRQKVENERKGGNDDPFTELASQRGDLLGTEGDLLLDEKTGKIIDVHQSMLK